MKAVTDIKLTEKPVETELVKEAFNITIAAINKNIAFFKEICVDSPQMEDLIGRKNKGLPQGIFAKFVIYTEALQRLEKLTTEAKSFNTVLEIHNYQLMILKELEHNVHITILRME